MRLPLSAVLMLSIVSACGSASDDAADAGPRRPAPRLSDALISGCYGWPNRDFTPENQTGRFEPGLAEGALAVDFALRSIDGVEHRLSELLREKPVFLQTASWTCTIYQDNLAPTNALATRSTARGDTYGDAVHFVHAYVIEAHPAPPDNSPYRGVPWPQRDSDRGQALTAEKRLSDAQETAQKLSGNQLMLVDTLAEEGANPVWCTYGPCPNCAYLIDTDGTIVKVQRWLEVDQMAVALDELLAAREQATR